MSTWAALTELVDSKIGGSGWADVSIPTFFVITTAFDGELHKRSSRAPRPASHWAFLKDDQSDEG